MNTVAEVRARLLERADDYSSDAMGLRDAGETTGAAFFEAFRDELRRLAKEIA